MDKDMQKNFKNIKKRKKLRTKHRKTTRNKIIQKR